MATTIKLKNSVTATNAPSSLVQGEVAINVTDKKVWVGNAATTPIQLLGGGADGSFTNISVSGVASFADGTVSLPAITNIGDTNTGIFFPAADTIAFTEGGVESMRINSAGNMGIGETSIASDTRLHLKQTADNCILKVQSSFGSILNLINGGGSEVSTINATGNNVLTVQTGSTERMRITSAGNLLVGTTAAISSGFTTISYVGTALNGLIISESANTSDTSFLGFNNGATNIGSVSRVGATSAVIYSTTSDERLKSNIADANPVLDKLMDVKVRQFDWTEGNLHQDAGFIAQELAPVLSGIVTKGKTEEDMWQLDYSRLTPYLVKAIQEQQTLITNLTTRLNALEGK